MSEVAKGYTRVRMVRHEYVSEGWASHNRGRLLSGKVYDVPNEDGNGKPVAKKWVEMGIAQPSRASMTTREEEMEMSGVYDAGQGPPASRGIQPDGQVLMGVSEEQLKHPDAFPEGGMREMSAAQVQQSDAGQQAAVPGAFSAADLERRDDDDSEVIFNRSQLKNLADVGYVTPEDIDTASDEDLILVDGVGAASIAKYRASREALKATSGQRGQPGPLPGQ